MNIAIQSDTAEVADLRDLLRKANDEARRYRNLWNAVESGEINANEAALIDAALSAYAESKHSEASGLDALARRYTLKGMTGARVDAIYQTSRELNMIASHVDDLRDKFLDGEGAYIMPPEM